MLLPYEAIFSKTSLRGVLGRMHTTVKPDILEIEQRLISAVGEERISLLLQLTSFYNDMKDRRALRTGQTALQEALLSNLPEKIVLACKELADFYSRTLCEFKPSLDYLKQSQRYLTSVSNPPLVATIWRLMGNNHHLLGDFSSALKCFFISLDILETLPEKPTTVLNDLGGLYYNLSVLSKETGNLKDRETYLNKANFYFEQTGSKAGLAKVYNGLGSLCSTKQEFEKALEFHFKSLQLQESNQNLEGIAISQNNIGAVCIRLGRFEEAFAYLDKSLAIKMQTGNPALLAGSWLHLGEAYFHTGKFQQALENLQLAEKVFAERSLKSDLLYTSELLAQAHTAIQNFQEASRYYKLALDLNREIFSSEKNRALVEIRQKNESERIEREAELFKLKAIEVRDYIEQLEIKNKEFQELVHVASHDLKEPIRMMISYLGLLKSGLGNTLTGESLEYFNFVKDAANRLDALLTGVLNLFRWETVDNAPLHQIDFNQVVKEALARVNSSLAPKNARFEIQPMPVLRANESQMSELFFQLFSNALTFNRSAQPEVKTSWENHGSFLLFKISDNGIGIPAPYREKVFSLFQRLHPQQDFPGIGAGLTIARKIVLMHKGAIWIEESPAQETTICFTLPVLMGEKPEVAPN